MGTLSFQSLAGLSQDACKSLRLRHHKNIHASYAEPCQRILNAIGVDSYIRPHRHTLDPKSETLIALRGLFSLITFKDDGTVQNTVRFGTERYESVGAFGVGVELTSDQWHTVVALEPDSILLEVKAGPFDPYTAKEVARWAPEEDAVEARQYFETLRSIAQRT